MLSLRERLRKEMPSDKKPARPAPESCYVTERRLPRQSFHLPEMISSEVIYLLTGEEHPPLPLENILFMDTETTGLSGGAGTVAFEIGVGYFDLSDLVIRQYVMRDYDEEGLMLSRVLQDMEGRTALCTFNGKTFDLPLLSSRLILNRRRMPECELHLDLLHISRRVWKLRLGRCNLTNLECAVLGREREDDLPGKDVPERFFNYLKTKDFSLLQDVLDHNFQDIASLADILYCLIEAHTAPERIPEAQDVYSVGRVLLRRGRGAEARICFRLADRGQVSAPARMQLALSLKKEKDFAGAERVYLQMIEDRQCRLTPYIELAKLYEHRLGRPQDALRVTLDAMRLSDSRDEALLPELRKRYLRLIKLQGGN